MTTIAHFSLTQSQRDIYLDQLRCGDSPLYNVGGYIRLGRIDPVRLHAAHRIVVAAHDAFGIRITEADGDVVQYVSSAREDALPIYDFSVMADSAQQAQAWLDSLFVTPLFQHDAELFRAFLLKIGENEFWYVGLAHHMAMDGWGFGNWGRRIADCYNGVLMEGATDTWHAVVEADRQYLEGPRAAADRAYWRARLAELPDQLLAAPARRALADEARSERALLQLNDTQWHKLEALAREAGVGVPQVLLGLLSVYARAAYGQDRFVIGVPVHSRTTYRQKQTIGLFTNIGPALIDMSPGMSLLELLRALGEQQRRDLRHQRYPLGDLLRDIGLQGGERRLYDIGFNYLKLNTNLMIGAAPAALVYLSHHRERTPLMVTVWQQGPANPVEIQFDYNLDYFSAAEVSMLSARFAYMIEQCSACASLPIAAFDVVPPDERSRLLALNPAAPVERIEACLHHLFEAQAEATPGAIALCCGEQRLSYRELNQRANRVAHRLRETGVGPDTLVGLCVERSADMVVGMLAILKAGGAYVPLDPAYPLARRDHMCRDSGARVLLTQSHLTAAPAVASTIMLDRHDELAYYLDSNPLDSAVCVAPNHLAYLIYTSGSTGHPKGVMICHRNAVALLRWAHATYSASELRSVLASTSLNFDLSVFEIFVPLTLGTRCVIVRDALALVEQAYDVSLINTVPSAIQALLEQGAIPPSAEVINLAGEPLPRTLLNELLAHTGCKAVYNLYGPTEDTTYSTFARFSSPVSAAPGIGRAVDGSRLYVLGAERALSPFGSVGELFIGGAGVARGYWNQPALTKEKFLPDPFGPAGEQMYRTGDLVRWQADETLVFLGRLDQQVKIRGFRVELGEIESQLLGDPIVRDAVVVARGDAATCQLVAYVVVSEGVAYDPAALGAHLRSRLGEVLADYMVPAAFVVLERLPLSPNGKIDKHALPAPDVEALQVHVDPVSPAETALAAIWSELLGLERIGTNANFFEIGGNSLLLTRMIHIAFQRHGLIVSVQQVFRSPTLGALAASIDGLRCAVGGLGADPACMRSPLSFAQQRIWFADRMATGPAHNIVGRVRLAQPLSEHSLRAAIGRMVARHDILRTRFVLDGEFPEQVVEREAPLWLESHDLRQAGSAAAADALFAGHAQTVFDTTVLPLFSMCLVQRAESETELQISIHHAIADGWSMVLFFDELLAAAHRAGNGTQVAAPQFSYRDYVHWQRAFLDTAEARRQEAFWRDYLHNCNEQLALPFQAPMPSRRGVPGQVLTRQIGETQAQALRALGKRASGSLFNVLHAALVLLLSRLSGERDLNIGIPVTGRNLAGTEGIIGMFLNNLPLRSRIDLNQSFAVFLRAQVENAASVLSHQDLPFEKILEQSGVGRSVDASPLFQVFLNMLSLPKSVEGRNLFTEAFGLASTLDSKFNLSLYVNDGPEAISLHCTFNEIFLAPRDVELVLDQYACLLAQVVADPRTACGDYLLRQGHASGLGASLGLLGEASLPDYTQPLQLAWGGSVQSLFAEVADRWPQRLALACEGRAWTYSMLQRMTDAYCARLQALGVRPGDVVAVLTERSDSLVIATMAIMKAGAAFMMLSRSVPELRLLQQVEAVPPRCLIALEPAPLIGPCLRAYLDAVGCAHLYVCATARVPEEEEVQVVRHASGADDLAYIAFTSGTEGRPKAIRGRHGSLTAFMPWMRERFALGPEDRFGMLSGLVHDPLHRDIFTPLCMGAALFVPLEEEVVYSSLNSWLLERQITVLHLTPSLGTFLSSVCDSPVASLRIGFFVGEIITTAHLRQFRRAAPAMRVINIYGSTETGRAISYYDGDTYPDGDRYCTDTLPVGVGIEGVQLLLLNERMTPCGVGEMGQIAVRSHYMSLGYHNDPDLNSEKFIQNPFTAVAGDKLYLTGDTGRYRRDGVVECLGRKDRQVKVRGFRIELPEIQVCLSAHPAVRQVAVVSATDARRETVIIAYVATQAGQEGTAAKEGLLAFMEKRLPAYMIPAEIVFVDEIPRNENGKLDQAKLPQPGAGTKEIEVDAPECAIESELLAMWQALFGQRQIGVNDDFFRIGGHSLLATQLLVRIERQFGCALGYRDFFKGNSIRAVAKQVTQAKLTMAVRRSASLKQQLTL